MRSAGHTTDGWAALAMVTLLAGVAAGALLLLAVGQTSDRPMDPPATVATATRPSSTPQPDVMAAVASPLPSATRTPSPLPTATTPPPSATATPTPTRTPDVPSAVPSTVPPSLTAPLTITMTLTSQPLLRSSAVVLLTVTPGPGSPETTGVTGPILADRVPLRVRADGCDDPALRVVDPEVGARVAMGGVIRGTANLPGQARYQLRLEVDGTTAFTPLIDATLRVVNGRLGVVRLAQGYTPGVSVLVLEAYDAQGVALGQCRVPVLVGQPTD